MSHASDLYDQKSQQGRVEGSKDDAVQKAGEYAMSLFPKEVRCFCIYLLLSRCDLLIPPLTSYPFCCSGS